ncbi:unnamed protein product [Merluccius merluccius]
MTEATRGWQPFRDGPAQVKIQAVSLSEEDPPVFQDACDASQAAAQQQRQLFESQLLVSTGDEALDVWDRYVTWCLQMSDGQRDAGLQALLEKAVMQFANKSYFDDPRYIGMWIKLAQNSSVPGDMFRYMEAQEVGRSHAAFYVAWAQHLEGQGDLQQAARVLQEGLSCNAQPLGSIQQSLRCVQVKLSGAGVTADVGSPPRASQVDLRPRGRKRLAESAGCSVELNLQLPSVVPRGQSLPLLGPGAPAEEGPHTARSLAADPREELEAAQLPSCEGSRASEEGGVAGKESGADDNVRSMYCKELLTNGVEEFCFEELRAQRYALGQRQEVDEKIRRLKDLEEKLKQELEEKQRLLLLRRSQPAPLNQVDEGGSGGGANAARKRPAAEPLQIFSNPVSGSASTMPDDNHTASMLSLQGRQIQPNVQRCLPASGREEAEFKDPGVEEGRLSLTEAAVVVGGVQNITLCAVPDNTRDFAGSAHLVSTPCIRRGPSSNADHQGVVSQQQGAAPRPNHPGSSTGNKLSPVLEAHTTSSSLGSSVATDDPDTSKTGEDPPLRDPCSGETRKHLLDQVEVSSFPGYHTVGTPLPHVDQDTQLSLGGEVVFILSKLQEEEQFSVFSGLSQGKHMVLKVERSLLPWDFYVVSQLRRRLSPGDSASLPHARCFLFLDACVTLYAVPRHQRLSEWVGLSEEAGVASVVSSLLLMMRTFHSSSLLLGALHTDSMLLLTHGDSGDSLLCVDLLSSLDLQLQPDLTSASQVPAALRYLQQGVLKTTDSPYQVELDLVCLAEAVHLLLTKRKMVVVEEEDGWMVEELGRATARVGRKSLWRKLFHLLLNSSGGSSLSVLTQLLDLPVATTPGGHRDDLVVAMAI